MSHTDLVIAPFHYEFLRRGILSAVLLSVSGGLLGSVLVLRRMALMGDALSHSLLPGIALAWLMFGPNTLALFVGALLAGLLTALGSALLSRLTRIKEDAAFGSMFIVFFGAGIALLSRLPTRLNLEHFLFGSILGVSAADLRLAGAASALTLLVFGGGYRSILLETFDPVFYRASGGRGSLVHVGLLALTVLNLVAAMQTMGVVLALGLFLLPGASAYLWCDRFSRLLLLSVVLAMVCSVGGILVSYHAGNRQRRGRRALPRRRFPRARPSSAPAMAPPAGFWLAPRKPCGQRGSNGESSRRPNGRGLFPVQRLTTLGIKRILPMPTDLAAVKSYLQGLQDRICAALAAEDGGSFREDDWKRPEGGGGLKLILAE